MAGGVPAFSDGDVQGTGRVQVRFQVVEESVDHRAARHPRGQLQHRDIGRGAAAPTSSRVGWGSVQPPSTAGEGRAPQVPQVEGRPEGTAVVASALPGSGANRRSRRLLVTTNTELNAIAAPAIIGLSSPAMASGIAATL